MQEISEKVITEIANIFSSHINIHVNNLPFTLFFFGSPARNLMLPNSDLDIGLVYEKDCEENLKKYLEEKINSLPFDKIDIADWKDVDEMMEENCNSMIEYNKSVDAKYVAGNTNIANTHQEKVKDIDNRDSKIKRFITEFGIFHLYDYKNKKTDYGENLKYDYGGSRDIIFLDWYYGINSDLDEDKDEEHTPFFEKGLSILEKQEMILLEESQELKKIIEIILLVKFTLLSKFKENNDESLLYSSKKSLNQCYSQGENAFNNLDIKNEDELFDTYFSSRIKLDGLVKKLKDSMLEEDFETAEIWNVAEKEQLETEEIQLLLSNNDWQNIVPFAIHSTSNDVLGVIVSNIKNLNGYEYILRIISQNDFIEADTIESLMFSRLPEKYKEKLKNK